METTLGARRFLVVALALAGIYVVNSVAAADDVSSRHRASDQFWGLTRLRADEVESFDSLEEMTKSADAVVVGHVVDTGPSRSFRAMDEKAEVDTAN